MKKNINIDKCIFCEIISKKNRNNVIFENDYVIVLLDIFPASDGHLLIIPKYCAPNILELPENYLIAVAKAQKIMAGLIMTKFSPKGLNFLNNFNSIAGQAINHYHLHLIPKYEKNFGLITTLKSNPSSTSKLKNIYEKLTE